MPNALIGLCLCTGSSESLLFANLPKTGFLALKPIYNVYQFFVFASSGCSFEYVVCALAQAYLRYRCLTRLQAKSRVKVLLVLNTILKHPYKRTLFKLIFSD